MHPNPIPTTTAPAEPAHYTVAIPGEFAYATERELTIPAPHTADEIALVIHAELTEFGYAHLTVDVDLAVGVVRIVEGGRFADHDHRPRRRGPAAHARRRPP